MKHKVAELEGVLLDAAVAKAEGWPPDEVAAMVLNPAGAERYLAASTSWALGGPIIERERIDVETSPAINAVEPPPDRAWSARGFRRSVPMGPYKTPTSGGVWMVGPTPLIAAMRAYVASKFGDEVEL
jgi:hypothetical protein